MPRLNKNEKIKVGVGIAVIAIVLAIAAFSHLATSLLSFPQFVFSGWNIPNVATTSEGASQEQTFAVDEVQELDIVWVGDQLRIVPGDGDEIRVREEIDAGTPQAYSEPAEISLQGSTLSISSDTSTDIGTGNLPDKKTKFLTIEVPRGAQAFNRVSLDGMIDAATLTDLTAGELSIDGMVGDTSMTGEVSQLLAAGGMAGDLAFHLTGTAPARVQIDGMVGDVTLALPRGTGFIATVGDMAGDIDSNLDLAHDGDTYRYGDEACRISLSGMAGNLEISES